MSVIQKPRLKNYLSIQHFLQDLYSYRKRNEPGFSYESWSQELDFNNRSFLRQVVIGRRSLTMETAQILKKRLNLEGSDNEYFDLLISYSRARTAKEKEAFGISMARLIKSDESQNEIADYAAFVSNPLHPRLQTLLSFSDIRKTPQNLAKILQRSESEIEQALHLLRNIGIAESDQDKNWKSLVRSFKVQEELGSQALLHYHRKALEEAIEAQTLPVQERRYRSLLLPLNPEELSEFMIELNEFAERMKRRFDVDSLKGRKLYQINLNSHSVSQRDETFDDAIDFR